MPSDPSARNHVFDLDVELIRFQHAAQIYAAIGIAIEAAERLANSLHRQRRRA